MVRRCICLLGLVAAAVAVTAGCADRTGGSDEGVAATSAAVPPAASADAVVVSASSGASTDAAAAPVPTAVVLDIYGQVLGDACERLATGDTTLVGPAGATSPLNAGPPDPADEPAHAAIDSVPVPAGAVQIDERSTSSLDEPDAHGIARVYCIPETTPVADVAETIAWTHAHRELPGADDAPVTVDAVYNASTRQLYLAAHLGPADDASRLTVSVDWTPVAPAASGGTGTSTTAAPDAQAFDVDIECAPATRLVVNDRSGKETAATPALARAACAAIQADPTLLLPSEPPAACTDDRAWELGVNVLGHWDGQTVVLYQTSCDPQRDDAARRWLAALGLPRDAPAAR